jgi:osmotically-inducible protein OsmY
MRTTAMWMVIGLCGVSMFGCAAMQKEEKAIQADVSDIKKGGIGGAADDAMKAAVTAALVKDDKADAAKIQVEAKSGVVTLKGSGDKALAEKIAKGVPGVTKVDNQMK